MFPAFLSEPEGRGEERFGVYLHWPFCLSKCPYCDFNSQAATAIDQERWRTALLAELAFFAEQTAGRTVSSVFFGGGTPSLMAPSTVAALLEAIARDWRLAQDAEITLEANPGTVDAARFRDLRAAGIGRLSMGLQALDDASLRMLGRRHDVAQALAAVDLARRIFPRISFDLIYARPGQSGEAWKRELRRAIALAADHLSLYQLTLEDGTAFYAAWQRGDFAALDEETAAQLFEMTQEICEGAGLPAYEISNHARPGAECQHNLLYWQGDDYLGIGPGAHGRLTDATGTVWAIRQIRSPHAWLAAVDAHGHGTEERLPLTPRQRGEELVMMGLRLRTGIEAARFARRAGFPLREALDHAGLATLTAEGFVEWTGTALRVTTSGRLLLNAILAKILR